MNILITGVTKGIGLELTKEFIKRGDKVFGVARTLSRLKDLEKEYPQSFIPLNYDISLEENIHKIFSYLEENSIKIDILVNNAGVGALGKFQDISLADNQRIINLNILSLVNMTHKFLNYKKYDKFIGIINISSTGAFQVGGPYFATYYGTKSFVSSFTNSLITENPKTKEKDFRIMGVYPGPTSTEFVGMKDEKSFYIMDSQKVASIIIDDFFKGKDICIPGVFNKFLVILGKFIPRKLELKLLKKIQLKKIKKI